LEALVGLDFDGRVIVVTGAGRGMGAAYAVELAKRGARVVVNDVGGDMHGEGASEQPAAETVAHINQGGGTAIANGDTVASAEGCDSLIAHAVREFGRLDGVLHNAGIATFAPLAEMSAEEFERILRVHLYGAFFLTRAAWPHLAARGGSLLYITSGAGLYGVPSLGHYAAAKVGMVGLARVASSEGTGVGIRANALAVAASTRMMDSVMAGTPNLLRWFQTYMRPELPAAAAVWLMHPDCPATGRVFEAFGPRMAEVLIGETRGYEQLDIEAEDYRDHFDEIVDRAEIVVPEGPDDFHSRMFGYIVSAGAEPPQPDDTAAEQISVGQPPG
jgi:NAD(P)-dependent dehydrogenase (short-subunit alcohol dehydrogenase family)